MNDKLEALKALVYGAVAEQEYNTEAFKPFEGRWSTAYLDRLIEALKTSDALVVLADALKSTDN